MHIIVRMHGELGRIAGSGELSLHFSGNTVRDLLERLVQELGPAFARRLFESDTSNLRSELLILVNGHTVRLLDGMDTQLSNLDDVEIETVEIAETVGGG